MAQLATDVDLDTVRAFMNTADIEAGTDQFAELDTFGGWLADNGLAAGPDAATEVDLARARRLRSSLRDLASANHDNAADPDATRVLNDLAATVGLTVRFTADGELELTSAATGVTRSLASLIAAVAAATADGTWRRVKLCASDTCRWAFQDSSRNRSGRWCSMAVCGNRMKARNFRSRHDPAAQQGSS